jgi:uncharacterized protein GlcG (DUF336 family)
MPAYRVSRNRRDSRPSREAASRRNVIEGALARKAAMLFDTMRQEFTMPQLTLAKADTIIDTALALGRERKFARLTVAVLDAGGHLVALKREDGSGILRADIAYGKAWGALGMGFSSREISERAGKHPVFYSALFAASLGRVIPSPGGVLICDAAGEVVGAVGISGDTGENDEACAFAGIAAAGLEARPASRET